MGRMEIRLCDYFRKTGGLPPTLAALPEDDPRYGNSILDGWGRPIQYINQGGTVTLLSLGKDAQPGGEGLDADIWTRFTPPEPSWISGATDQGELRLSPTVDARGNQRN